MEQILVHDDAVRRHDGRAVRREAEDEHAIDEMVLELNRIYMVGSLATAREVGTYILRHFFDGDPEAFRRSGNRHVSFRRLAQHPQLRMPHAYLYQAVAVTEQLRQLPEHVGEALTLAHHKMLLAIKDPAEKMRLAEHAVSSGCAGSVHPAGSATLSGSSGEQAKQQVAA